MRCKKAAFFFVETVKNVNIDFFHLFRLFKIRKKSKEGKERKGKERE
jgi:hypothetical protein